MFRTYRRMLPIVIALFLLTAGARAQVVVGSKLDTEATLLGNMILLTLEANGIATEDRTTLGGTPVVRKAITAGEIDIYPEYTGNAAFFFNKADDPVWKDLNQGYETAKKLDYDANKIVWLSPAPANNTWAIAVRTTRATRPAGGSPPDGQFGRPGKIPPAPVYSSIA